MPHLTLDTGNTGFMLLCSSLVMLMTPGLAFFYGGLVGRKNVLAIMMQSFTSMGWTTVLWWAFGFSVCFSGDVKSGTDYAGIIGNFHWAFLNGITLNTPSPANDTIPLFVFFGYQMMFAIITPALITGAFANRVRFPAYMLFLTGWLILVYFPFVHMIWGGGIMAQWGVLDFAGGIVVHNIAGIAALASVLYVGRRRVADRGPHSIPLVALGTGLLWFGLYGFPRSSSGFSRGLPASTPWRSRTSCAGTTRWMCGACTGSADSSASSAAASSRAWRSIPPARTAYSMAIPISSSCSSAPFASPQYGRSPSPMACSG